MKDQLEVIKKDIDAKISEVTDMNELNLLKSNVLGKKSELQQLMIQLKDLPNEEKPLVGKLINEVKQNIAVLFDERKLALENAILEQRLNNEEIDVTLPGVKLSTGSIHLLTQVQTDIEDFFIGMGYEIKDGPEVESDHYNFEMLNLEKDHPARAMQDSFYIDVNRLLRTHTSPVQARTMLESNGKEIKIICPGKVYRRDDDDQTHSHQFMQIEGLVIGKDISFADLKGTLLAVIRHFFR